MGRGGGRPAPSEPGSSLGGGIRPAWWARLKGAAPKGGGEGPAGSQMNTRTTLPNSRVRADVCAGKKMKNFGNTKKMSRK